MSISRVLVVAAAAVLCLAAGVAAAGNYSSDGQIDFYASGTHQFFVWCPSTDDYMATAEGADAKDAQMKLYTATKASGQMACWPVWQGRLADI